MMLAAALVGVVAASVLLALFHTPAPAVPIDGRRHRRGDGGGDGGWWAGDGDGGSDCSAGDGGGCD